jgi:hypothetical protein
VGPDASVISTGELITVVPFIVAFTNRATVTGTVPAVKSTGLPVVELIVPMVLVRFHE